MRIAQVTDLEYAPGGGVEQSIINLVIGQKARGDDPIVVVPKPGGLTRACEEYGIPVAIEPRLAGRMARPDMGPGEQARKALDESRIALEELSSLFTKSGVDVVHCHAPHSAMKAITAGNRSGIPCVFTHHIQRELRVPDLDFALIAVCRSHFEQLMKDGFPAERLHYVPNGTRSVPRGTDGLPSARLIFVGRLEHRKAPEIAILAMAELKRRHGPDCPPLNVYGTGPMEGYLKEIVSVLRLDDTVHFHGVQQGILDRCPPTDVLVLSSHAEACPMVVLEALSRGMAIVATGVGEIEEIVPDARYGYVVRSGSITALADGVDSMLSDIRAGRFDPDATISRHRELYSAERMAERVDAVYKSLMTDRASVG